MTNLFLIHRREWAIGCETKVKRILRCFTLIAFGALASPALTQTTLTYDDGDLFIGFRATDRPSDYLVNIGPPDQFRDAQPGSSFQVNAGNLLTDLMTTFDSDWYSRIDPNTATNAVLWAVVGGRVIAGGGDPADTLYATNPSPNPWPRQFAQGFTTSLISAMGNTFAGNQSTANNPNGLIQNANSNNSYASFQPGGENSGGISFQTWNPWNEGVPNATLYFNRILVGTGPSTVLGFFTLNNSGQLTFNASGGATPTPTPTPGPTPTPCPSCTPTPTPTPGPPTPTPGSPTPTPTPGSPTPSPTPGATPTVLGNISTRLRVETGDNVLIGGFIVTGTQTKRVIVRAIGPSLPFSNALADPFLELRDSSGVIRSNNNWRSDQQQEILDTTIPPSNDFESAIVQTLPANNSAYTAVVSGMNNGVGVGLVEVYDLDSTTGSKLANISTRGLVQTGNDVMIAGTIVLGQTTQRVLVRAIGPSLPFSGVLADPTLELRDGSGNLIRSNNDWRTDQEQEIMDTGAPPTNDMESAIVATLPAGGAAYTAVVSGVNNTSGIALVEIYAIQ